VSETNKERRKRTISLPVG